MKKFLAILVFACAAITSIEAQTILPTAAAVRITYKDTLTNVDTSNKAFNSVGSNVKSFAISVSKISGTLSGKIYLQGTDDGIGWDNLDSLTLADVTTIQKKTTFITHTYYNSYREYIPTTGTQSFVLWFTCVRRPDELY